MAEAPNAEQAEFWNLGPGQNWVEFQADLDALHEGVTEVLLRAAAPRAGEAVLDVGCGAGATSLALAAAVAPSGRVLGVDISAPLLRRAEERRRELGIGNLGFELADAQARRFEAGAFDLVASRFGVMFFADPVAAFRNLAAGLRPGGRLAFAAWAGPERNPWFTLPQRIAVARLGPVEPSPPDAPGPMAFRDIGRVCGILEAAGLSDCTGESLDVELHHPGGLEAVVRLAGQVGVAVRLMREKQATPEDRAAILDAIAAEFARFRSADGIRVPAGINLFTAARR